MLRPLCAALLLLAGCGDPFGDDPFAAEPIPILVRDDPATLSDGKERLFSVQYCAQSGGPDLLVSDLRTELAAQGLHWRSGYSFRYELTLDLNRDHRFGPGDVLTVSEGEWGEFDAADAGTAWKVSLQRAGEFGDEAIGEADWFAR